MARIHVHHDHIDIELTTWEKVGGLLRDQRVPLASITDVAVEDDAFGATSGIRAPGFALPGRTKVGTWRATGCRQLVCASAGRAGVRIDAAADGPFDRYLVEVDDPAAVVEAIRSRV